MENKVLKQRMYSFVVYNLSPIQAGIQASHAIQEYANMLGNTDEFKQWALKDKTIIILNGGTTNDIGVDSYSNEPYKGSMQKIIEELEKNKINFSTFREVDLNNATTSISFLVDERVWHWEKYPNLKYDPLYITDTNCFERYKELYDEKVAFLKIYLPKFNLANN